MEHVEPVIEITRVPTILATTEAGARKLVERGRLPAVYIGGGLFVPLQAVIELREKWTTAPPTRHGRGR